MHKAAIRAQIDKYVGTQLDGRYLIQTVLGHGGMGVVFKGVHVHMNSPVAIKMILGGADEIDVSRFKREAQAISMLKHPNIISVKDFGLTADQNPYMVMDLVDGPGLDEIIRGKGAIPADIAIPLFYQLADGLTHAHRKGIIHRDLKPSNLMLVPGDDGAPHLYILDFGLAKLDDSANNGELARLTQTGAVMGTPFYMSPEQCLGQKLDQRSDIYAVGCIMYEVLCGQVAINGENILQILNAQLNEIPAPLPDSVPAELRQLVFRAMAKSPDARFQSMQEIKDLLKKLTVAATSLTPEPAKISEEPQTMERAKHYYEKFVALKDSNRDEAIALIERAIHICERHHLPREAQTLSVWLYEAGRECTNNTDKSEVFFKKSIAVAERAFGDTHELLIEPLIGYANLLYYTRKAPTQAEPIYRRAINLAYKTLPGNDIRFADTAWEAGSFYSYESDHDKAQKCFLKAVEIRKAKFGENDPGLARIYTRLGKAFESKDDNATALNYHKLALKLGKDDPAWRRTDYLINLGWAYENVKRIEEGETYMRQAVELARSENDLTDLAFTTKATGAYLCRMKQYAPAEPFFLDALEVYSQMGETDSEGVKDVLEDLIQVYQSVGNKQAEMQMKARLASLRS